MAKRLKKPSPLRPTKAVVNTFGMDAANGQRYGQLQAYTRKIKRKPRSKVPEEIYIGLRGACVAAQLAFNEEAADDHRIALVRVQELAVDMLRIADKNPDIEIGWNHEDNTLNQQ